MSLSRLAVGPNEEQIRQVGERINTSCYQMLRFTVDYTAYLRYTLGNQKFLPAIINITELLEQLCGSVKILTNTVGIPLTEHLPDKALYIDANDSLLIQALLHIISNSCMYTRQGNKINLTMAQKENDVVIHIGQGHRIPFDLTKWF
jgi:signal transduction histidine kinase